MESMSLFEQTILFYLSYAIIETMEKNLLEQVKICLNVKISV
jgi:hypothetical protein